MIPYIFLQEAFKEGAGLGTESEEELDGLIFIRYHLKYLKLAFVSDLVGMVADEHFVHDQA